MMTVRKAAPEDLAQIMQIYSAAQDFMIASGNPGQWGKSYPPEEQIVKDIEEGVCFVVCEAPGEGEEGAVSEHEHEAKEPHAVFAVCAGDEPTYQVIDPLPEQAGAETAGAPESENASGRWLNDEPYVTVHRAASDGKLRGVFACIMNHLKGRYDNVRIDTHQSNAVMQKQIEKSGFKKCGIIYVRDGSPRIAFHWVRSGGTMKLETERLILRRHIPEDAAPLYRDFGLDPEMSKYSGWNPYATEEMAAGTVAMFLGSYADDRTYSWAVEHEGRLIGTFGAYDYDEDENSIEIGCSIARDCWGQGFGGEAAKAVIEYLTQHEGIARVKAWCADDNVGSAKIMERAGMALVSREPMALEIDGKKYDKLNYEFAAETEI